MTEAPNTEYLDSKNKLLQFIEDVTSKADQVQNNVLEEILSTNACVEYLQLHGLNGHTDSENFKKLIPVVQYEDIEFDIRRIANGDTTPIFCSKPISEFFTSSGTSSGEVKLIPAIEFNRKSVHTSLKMSVMSQFIPNLDKGKAMLFQFIRYEVKTPGGLVARPALTSYYKSSHFKNRPYDPYTDYTSPNETILCPDSYQSMYSQMLCGLCQHSEVLSVGAVFASTFINAMRFLEKHWPMLCCDIRNGTLTSQITDVSVREAVLKILINPNPKLADFIESECGKSSWQGIITRIWPNTKYVDAIITGTMSHYIPTLDYYSNGLPLVSFTYGSSEGYFGFNLNPLCKPSEVAYTILPSVAYFEFLPINGVIDEQLQELVDLVDVKLGHEYELVVTTYAGLYRYRVGDVLRVAGFKNKVPQFSFICRKNVVLSIDFDKTDEVDLLNAMKNAGNNLIPFDASVSEYTSYADTTTSPGHYVLFWEIRCKGSTPISSSVYEDCCLTVEESLNSVYREGRVSDKSIGPLEIKIVEAGTFDKLMDYSIGLGASMSQYKTPRCVKSAGIVELLNSRVVASYFSPKCPKWAAGHKQWHNSRD